MSEDMTPQNPDDNNEAPREKKCGMLCKLWIMLKSPASKYSCGSLLSVGLVAGVIFWGGFNTFMEYTNTLEFCISCHEMERNVYREYRGTVHYTNRTGVRAVCADCHVPKDWGAKMVRKIQASAELYHKVMGTIDTPEKFNKKRLTLAKRVWATMEGNDSRECRNCHSYEAMDFHKQKPDSAEMMQMAMEAGETCISCHKGIAHTLPEGWDE